MPTVRGIQKEDVTTIAGRLSAMWRMLEERGVPRSICRNSLIAPATCNLLNADKTATVERFAFGPRGLTI